MFASARRHGCTCLTAHFPPPPAGQSQAHKKAIRRATVNTFGYIAKAIGPQDVLVTLLNNLKVGGCVCVCACVYTSGCVWMWLRGGAGG